jgi:opacity protein-like surface antigen
MKKITFYFLTIAGMVLSSQLSAQQGWHVTVKAIPHASWIPNKSDKDNSDFESKTLFGAAFGVGAGYNFTSRTGVDLEVLYSKQGNKYRQGGAEFVHRTSYVKVPVTFNYLFNPGGKVGFVGKIGPQLSIGTEANLKREGKSIDDDTKECISDVAFGAVAGLGGQVALNSHWMIQAGVRYDYDFTNAENEDHPHHPKSRKKSHNSTLGVEVGLRYAFN